MSFTKISLILSMSFFVSAIALANEGGEGAGEGGGEKKEAPKKEKSQAIEYIEKTTKLNTYQVKLLDAQRDFDRLVEEKDHETDPKKKEEIIKMMVEVSKNRNKDVEDYDKVKQELLYQYPAKSAEINRMYETEQKRNVDEMQSVADLDDMLSRVKKVIERKFAPFNPENDKPKPAAKAAPPEEEPHKLKLEK